MAELTDKIDAKEREALFDCLEGVDIKQLPEKIYREPKGLLQVIYYRTEYDLHDRPCYVRRDIAEAAWWKKQMEETRIHRQSKQS